MGFIVGSLTGSLMMERKFVEWINLARSLVLGNCKRTNDFFYFVKFLLVAQGELSFILGCVKALQNIIHVHHVNYVNKIKGVQNKVITTSYFNMFRF
jgi:hypothetical protein